VTSSVFGGGAGAGAGAGAGTGASINVTFGRTCNVQPVVWRDGWSLLQFANEAIPTFLKSERFQPSDGLSFYFVPAASASLAVTDRTRVTDDNFPDVVSAILKTNWIDQSSPKPILYFHDSPKSPQGTPP
jgi:hypothetical protein